jgi:hypothetical protein
MLLLGMMGILYCKNKRREIIKEFSFSLTDSFNKDKY